MATPTAQPATNINLPKSDSLCTLAILDGQCDISVLPHVLVEPNIPGHKYLNLPTYCFHIKHQASGAEVIFDLGCKKDWQNSVPAIAELCNSHIPGFKVGDDVVNILEVGGVQKENLKAFILSHWHFDHCGDPATLDKKTDMLVGPGFKDAFYPGYPTKQDSTFLESAFKGRTLIEVPFDDSLKIGGFQAHDYFGDGSLYILNVPGHAVGHISALVRTTPDTAVFLGGDVCHFTGMIRPSVYKPLPDNLPAETARQTHVPAGCPCSAFTVCHPRTDKGDPRTTPFYEPSTHENSFYVNQPLASKSLASLEHFDADPNIMVIIAHDIAPKMVLPMFPNATINDWKQHGYKERMHWAFLNELPWEGEQRSQPLVDGAYDDQGKKIHDMEFNKV